MLYTSLRSTVEQSLFEHFSGKGASDVRIAFVQTIQADLLLH